MSDARGTTLLLRLKLGDRLRSLGYRDGLAVSQAGLDLISRAARKNGLKDWSDANNPTAVKLLASAVEHELKLEGYV